MALTVLKPQKPEPLKLLTVRQLMTPEQCAEFLQLEVNTLYVMKSHGRIPFRKVKQFALDNLEFRYLEWEEQPALLTVLENPSIRYEGRLKAATLKVTTAARARLRDAILIAVGVGLRRSEQLRLKPLDCDFSRNVIVVTKSKTGKSREVPMNDEVRAILQRLCVSKRRDDYLFVNPKTKRPFMDYKTGFHGACADAGIEGLTWRHLRATFGTRLGNAGYNAFEIAALMGHSDIRTTQRYVRVGQRLHEAVQSTMMAAGLAIVTNENPPGVGGELKMLANS
jgi:integrase